MPQGRYAAAIEKLRPQSAEPGDIVHLDGRVLARHQGILHYTVGQRRGLGLGGGEPLFVVRLDAQRRQVVVGPREALLAQEIHLRDVNWLGEGAPPSTEIAVAVKGRSGKQPAPAMLRMAGSGRAIVALAEPEEAIAPGQACVFYAANGGSRVLGGGWITRKPLN